MATKTTYMTKEKALSDMEMLTIVSLVSEGSLAIASKKLKRSVNTLSTHLTHIKRKWGIEASGNVGTVRLVVEYIRRYGIPS